MGQALCIESRQAAPIDKSFAWLPLDVGFRILEYLDATSLCNLALVNSQFTGIANSDYLWRRLCFRKILGIKRECAACLKFNWKQVHMMIQKFIYIFNMDAEKGCTMFVEVGLINPDPASIAQFLGKTSGLSKLQIGRYISKPTCTEVMKQFVQLADCKGLLLAEALKNFLARFELSKGDSSSRIGLIECFAWHYATQNEHLEFEKETISILCFSLILLGTDLSSPHVKNKMSKREFIRNNKRIVQSNQLTNDYLGELYDYVYLQGLFPIKQEPRRCNAVLNQLFMDSEHRWQIFPRVLPLHAITNT
jgi:F-box protein 8